MKSLLIIRHAERPTIQDGTVGNELSLTSNGIHETKRLAKSFLRKILSIESSPILRCVQTAELIAEHHELPLTSIGRSSLLGGRGSLSMMQNWYGRIGLRRALEPSTNIF